MPSCDPFVAPLLYAIPIELLAYDVAAPKGTDVDQPRTRRKVSQWSSPSGRRRPDQAPASPPTAPKFP